MSPRKRSDNPVPKEEPLKLDGTLDDALDAMFGPIVPGPKKKAAPKKKTAQKGSAKGRK